MERKDLILGIVDAERKAKQITNEAISMRRELEDEISQSVETMKQKYFDQANARIAKVRDTEYQAIQEQLDQLDEKRVQMLDKIVSAYEKYGDNWASTIFSLVIGRTQL